MGSNEHYFEWKSTGFFPFAKGSQRQACGMVAAAIAKATDSWRTQRGFSMTA